MPLEKYGGCLCATLHLTLGLENASVIEPFN